MNRDEEIIRLLKYHKSDLIREYIEEQKKQNYPADFTVFMDQMLKEHHIKRKEVALRSGLSQDYTYKLLNGTKKTTERDYILAICIAVGMNLAQTQHALSIYGMSTLDCRDYRSYIIYLALRDKLDIDGTNQWLEKAGFVYLKTSPDMPTAEIELLISPEDKEGMEDHLSELVENTFEEIDLQMESERCGNAPMDYNYYGLLTIEDENKQRYYILALYTMDGEHLYVIDGTEEELSLKTLLSDEEAIDLESYSDEQYDSIFDARNSEFFNFFMRLDHATDEKVIETMQEIDDTRNYETRVGAKFTGGHRFCYLESFNYKQPEKREYFQIVQKDGELRFTASHESYFMRMELGKEIYPAYFGNKREEEYYIDVKDTKDLYGNNLYLRFTFDDLLFLMHQYAEDNFPGLFKEDHDNLDEEELKVLIQRATFLMHQNNLPESLKYLQEAARLIEEAEKTGEDDSISLIVTYYKIAVTYENMGDYDNMYSTYEKICQMKDRVPKILAMDTEGVEDAIHSIADAMVYIAQRCQNMRGQYDPEAKAIVKEAIDLLDGRCTFEGAWETLFIACTKYAYMIDIDDPEESVKYCRKAVSIVNVCHLDQKFKHQDLVVTLYNNFAWVLWNKLGSEEAIIYYGRAIELLESYFYNPKHNKDELRASLLHEGEALYKVYLATNKNREAKQLIKRLAENNVFVE